MEIFSFLCVFVDRYVIIGCHYDAWTYGEVEPGTGTVVLMEVVKSFSALLSSGFVIKLTDSYYLLFMRITYNLQYNQSLFMVLPFKVEFQIVEEFQRVV